MFMTKTNSSQWQTLYLCYFGLREPLVQTQVLPYLRLIRESGIKVSLLTFEPKPKENWTVYEIETEKAKLATEGIEWDYLTYHKRPSALATAYDVLCGLGFTLKKAGKTKNLILHTRAHIPLTMALLANLVIKSKLIFDIRGLMAEEYVDAGTWKEGSIIFRLIKFIERQGLKKADEIVVLTNKMRDYLIENNLRKADSIQVIPCCVDFSRISLSQNSKLERFELIYAGSVTGLYMLEEMGRFFLALKKRRPDAFFRVLTATSPDYVSKTFNALGIDESDYKVQKVSPEEILNVMKKAHLAISFRKPTFAQIASSPTKIPEYLAAGLPVVSNAGIGDTDNLIEKNKTGVVVEYFDETSLEKAVDEALILSKDENLSERCFYTAIENFDLRKIGKNGYLKVYERIQQE